MPANTLPEITWSLMHPTTIDAAYMRRIIREAARYTRVGSFEICGAFANPAGGLNGLLLLEPYPAAASHCNKERVLSTRAELNEIVEMAAAIGKPVYLWHREIIMPKGMLEDRPSLLDANEEFDLLGADFEEFLRYKLDNAFRVVPGLGGVVLTLTEADYSVIHNSDPDRYPPDRVVEKIVRIFAEEHEKRGKRFILRSFGSIASDYEDILRGAREAAKDHPFEIETKITPYDFSPFLPPNPFLVRQPNTSLGAECDGLGEFLGAGYLPSANVDNIARYVKEGRAAGVSRYAIRLDRIGNSIFDCHEINLYAYHRLTEDDSLTADDVYREWAASHWQGCEQEMIDLSRMGLEAVKKTNFVCGNVVFHKFPILPEWKWVVAGGAIGLYRNGVPLKQLRGMWGILSEHNAPGREAILQEKREALQMAREGRRRVEALRHRLSPEEYRKAERVWRILEIAARGIGIFTECLAGYFDDLEAGASVPSKLHAAASEAEQVFTEIMQDTSDAMPTMLSCCDGAPLPGDDLDRVYLKGLRYFCRTLEEQYTAENALRQKWGKQPGVRDIVLPGAFGDQWRVFRYMHASHSDLREGLPVRYAGNTVFPNGFMEVEMAARSGDSLEIRFLPGSANAAAITVNGKCRVANIPPDGIVVLPAEEGQNVIRIEKSGVKYPGVIALRILA